MIVRAAVALVTMLAACGDDGTPPRPPTASPAAGIGDDGGLGDLEWTLSEIGPLGVMVEHPLGLDPEVAEQAAYLRRGPMYPVTITVDPSAQPGAGASPERRGAWDDVTVRTACIKIRCRIKHPTPYDSDRADVSRRICRSIAPMPSPARGEVRTLTREHDRPADCPASSWRALEPLLAGWTTEDARERYRACWQQALDRDGALAGANPRVAVSYRPDHAGAPVRAQLAAGGPSIPAPLVPVLQCIQDAAAALAADAAPEVPSPCTRETPVRIELGADLLCE